MNDFVPIRGRRLMLSAAILASVAVATLGCSPTADTRGNILLEKSIETIERGKQNRDQVVAILGSPSTTSALSGKNKQKETWYYIGKRTETLAFFEPTLVEHKILAIKFDERGLVETIAAYDASVGKPVEMVDRVTPTKGKDLGFLQQILGNLGRFSTPEQGL